MQNTQKSMKTMSGHGFSQFELTQKLLQNLNTFKLTPTAKLVLLYLSSCYNPKKAGMFPKQKTMSIKLGVSEVSVNRAIQELHKEGLVISERKYTLHYKYTPKFLNLCGLVRDLKEDNQQNDTKEINNLIIPYIEPKKEHKKEPTTNVVVLNQIPDIIKNNAQIKNKCAYWASLSNEIRQEYVDKDKQQKAKELDRQAFIEHKKQQERQKAKEQQELIAECNKPLSEQFTYESACTLIRNIAKLNKSFAYKGLPKELSTVFNINIDEIV